MFNFVMYYKQKLLQEIKISLSANTNTIILFIFNQNPHQNKNSPDLSKSTQYNPSSAPITIRSGSIMAALKAFLNNVTELSINSRAIKTVVFGKLLRFMIRCSSESATTHLFFSPSESANINVEFLGPGGSIRDVVICKCKVKLRGDFCKRWKEKKTVVCLLLLLQKLL